MSAFIELGVMLYLPARLTFNSEEITRNEESCQPLSSNCPMRDEISLKEWAGGFTERLLGAMGVKEVTELAMKLKSRGIKIKYSTLANYLNGTRKIPIVVLLRLGQLPECDLHFLMTGEVKKDEAYLDIFHDLKRKYDLVSVPPLKEKATYLLKVCGQEMERLVQEQKPRVSKKTIEDARRERGRGDDDDAFK
jgi:hypothetical protein